MKESELLRKQADMMDMAEKYGIPDWHELVEIDYDGFIPLPHAIELGGGFNMGGKYRFALCVCDNKPVFEGDKLYHYDEGSVVANNQWGKEMFNHNGRVCYVSQLSWNPPKPKTVMIELLREDAEYWKNKVDMSDVYQCTSNEAKRMAKACCKALATV